MTDNNENSQSAKILYLGDDAGFFNHLKENFIQVNSAFSNIEFIQEFSEEDQIIQSYIFKISNLRPRLLLIDLTHKEVEYLHLARIWSRLNFYQNIPIIILCSPNQNKSILIKAIASNLRAVHIKSQETDALIYHMLNLAYPEQVKNHGFATAQMRDPIHSYFPAKISMMNSDFFKIESNRNLSDSNVFKLFSYWERSKIIGSGLVKCVDQGHKNVYSNFKNYQVLQLAHQDPLQLQFADEMSAEEIELKKQDRQQRILESRARLDKWIRDNSQFSQPKNVRVLIVDKTHIFYDLKPQTDKYPFVLRSQPYLDQVEEEIIKLMPQIIIYNIENIDEETLKANADIAHTYNDSRSFQYLVKVLKKVYGENLPTFVCFNSGSYTSEHLQKTLGYPSILAVQEELSYDMGSKVIQKLYNQLQQRLPESKPHEMYIQKNSDVSYAEIETDIELIGCSENDIYFNFDQDLEIGEILRVNLPIPMFITVTAKPDWIVIKSKYYGIIHGIGEIERQALRRFINSVFFRDLDLAKAKDAEEIEKLKKDYLQDQQQQITDRLAEIEKEKAQKEAKMNEKADNLLKDL